MNEHLRYDEKSRQAATAQRLGQVTDRLAAEGIAHSIEQASGFAPFVRIPLNEPAWIGVTTSDDHPGTWSMVRYRNDANEGTVLLRQGSSRWHPPDEAVAAIHQQLALTDLAAQPRRRLVNAYVVIGCPDGRGGTFTVLGEGAWGRPDEAHEYAQRHRDAYHARHGPTPLAQAPWHHRGGDGLRPLYHPPGVAVGIEIHDVRTGEQWFVPTNGKPLGPIGPREQGPILWQATPPQVGIPGAVRQPRPGQSTPPPPSHGLDL